MLKSSGSSLFSQILKLFPRIEFQKLVSEYQSDKGSKGFTSWDHFVSMLFCQLASAKSLREITYGLKSCSNKTLHLGMASAPKKSTLSYANKNRSYELFESLFYIFLKNFSNVALHKKKKFRFKNKLFSLDGSIIDLCIDMFDWAKYKTTKGGIKLHLLLDHDGYLPTFAKITNGNVHEVNIARSLSLPPNSIVAMDKGYNDYRMYHEWTKKKIWFVTRLKENAKFDIVHDKLTPNKNNIVADQIIGLCSQKGIDECPVELRRVVFFDEEKNKTYQFLTNNLKLAASTIANIYKDRWEIELFFKHIKQSLKIKTFVGTTANAVRIQIWTALITSLITKYLKFISKCNLSLSNLIAILRWNLMVYHDLYKWIDDPFYTPPDERVNQPTLFD